MVSLSLAATKVVVMCDLWLCAGRISRKTCHPIKKVDESNIKMLMQQHVYADVLSQAHITAVHQTMKLLTACSAASNAQAFGG